MLNKTSLLCKTNKYSPSDLVNDVERLMLLRMSESRTIRSLSQDRPNYKWLCNRDKCIKMSIEQSVIIKRLAFKLTSEDCSAISIQLEDILIKNENVNSCQIPEIAKELLIEKEKLLLMKSIVPRKMSFFRRISSFRVSPESNGETKLRRFIEPSYFIFTISKNI
ncbi:uncharacterized protein LOC143915781 [Arctopsyche grandis]|uniref:uncharacterized protein LOC143915781 n=1 Tax=Arctopsyche grandis TaxID=121162 RepID=UPI00406D8B84